MLVTGFGLSVEVVIQPGGHGPFEHGYNDALGVVPPGQVECAADAQPHEYLIAPSLEVASSCGIAVVTHHVKGLFEAIALVALLIELEP